MIRITFCHLLAKPFRYDNRNFTEFKYPGCSQGCTVSHQTSGNNSCGMRSCIETVEYRLGKLKVKLKLNYQPYETSRNYFRMYRGINAWQLRQQEKRRRKKSR